MIVDNLFIFSDEEVPSSIYNFIFYIECFFVKLSLFIEFEELYVYYMLFLTILFIIYGVLGELTWYTHSFNKRNNFFFKKNIKKELIVFFYKIYEESYQHIFYTFIFINYFY
jgi:hypothetical protein